jgi:serine phosphatase RsbU (regulator of sigma subunit)
MNKAYAVEENLTNKQNLSYIYNNLAISYQYLNNHTKSLSYHFKALKLNEEMGNDGGTAVSYNNISGVYASIGKTNEALHYILKSVALNEKNNDKVGLTYAYIGAGDCYKGNKNYIIANTYYLKALKVAREINYRTEEREAYEHLAIMFEEMNDYQKALQYHKRYAQLKDSILNEESLKQSSEMNIRYETEKKEKEILLLTKDQELKNKSLQEQRLIRIGLILGLGLLLALSFLLFNRYRFKQKANLLLERQKEDIHNKNILITDSIDYAKNIQDAILPTPEYLYSLLPNHFIFYKPKDIVSGDFYWITKKENKIIFAVADCTGHGVPGAFMSLLGHNMLENVVNARSSPNPGAILTELNKEIVARFSDNKEASKHGMDIAIISIDTTNDQLEYAAAKNSLYLIRQNELTEIKGDITTLGTPPKYQAYHEYRNHVLKLRKDDMIYLFSDGFPDQKGGPQKKKFYYQPFKNLLISVSSLPPGEQRSLLDSAITEWMGDEEQIDDILIAGIRY